MKFENISICISQFVDEIINGAIIVDPDFQRSSVWNSEQQIMLIDSIMKRYPLPSIFVWSKGDKQYAVDGRQRTEAIIAFVQNKFGYNGKMYDEFSKEEYNAFNSFMLNKTVVSNVDTIDIVELFDRLNSGKRLTSGELMASKAGVSDIVSFTVETFFEHPSADIKYVFGEHKINKTKNDFKNLVPLVASSAFGMKHASTAYPLVADALKPNKHMDARMKQIFLNQLFNLLRILKAIDHRGKSGYVNFGSIAPIWGTIVNNDDFRNSWVAFYKLMQSNETLQKEWITKLRQNMNDKRIIDLISFAKKEMGQ